MSSRNILTVKTIRSFHVRQRFLIVLTRSVLNVPDALNEVFVTLNELSLLGSNVLIKDETSQTWSFHAFKPYATNCFTFETFQIETFSTENFSTPLNVSLVDLYPKREFKFHECKLFVAAFPFEPFVIVKNASNGTTAFSGIDVQIVNEIARTLNLTPIYMQPKGKKVRGEIFPNGTGFGALGMVMRVS